MLRTLGDAYKVVQLKGPSLAPFGAFYLATLGAASALYLDDKVGNFSKGKEADFLVLDAARTAIMSRRWNSFWSITHRLFALLLLCDDRIVDDTYLDGQRSKSS